MTTLQLLGYISDAWVLITYFVLTHTGKHTVAFHWANALGAAPILVAEVQLGAWQVLPLTGTFCALGWYGLLKVWLDKRWLDNNLRVGPFSVTNEERIASLGLYDNGEA